jgi:uncharacterized membrane protein YhaH (DUF805 family)
MTNYIFLFGTFAGLITISAMIALMVAGGADPDAWWSHSVFLGYLIMFVALSMIFFAVKRYRDQDLGGVIKFVPAFLMGVGISVVAGIIYVLVWEAYQAATNYTYVDSYVAGMLESERAKGTPPETVSAMAKEFETLKVQYKDPLFRIPMTFLEIFPVGLLVALISAALLRNSKVLPDRT